MAEGGCLAIEMARMRKHWPRFWNQGIAAFRPQHSHISGCGDSTSMQTVTGNSGPLRAPVASPDANQETVTAESPAPKFVNEMRSFAGLMAAVGDCAVFGRTAAPRPQTCNRGMRQSSSSDPT